MKKLIFAFAVITLISCNSNDDSGDVNIDQFQEIENILPQGTWEVSSYIEGSTDRTMEFESFVFTFNADNTVSAQNDLFTESGTWNYENSSNDPNSDEEKLMLQFGLITPFDLISEDWVITLVNNTKVELMVNSGSIGGTETLTFSKL